MDWRGILVGDVAWVGNFAVWICADGRYEETVCDTPNVLVLKIPIKDGDGDRTDDVNNFGDDSGRCDDSDDWPVVVDDDSDDDDDDDNDDDDNDDDDDDDDNEGGGDDITDDDNDIDTVTDEDNDETVGVGEVLSVTKDKVKRKN